MAGRFAVTATPTTVASALLRFHSSHMCGICGSAWSDHSRGLDQADLESMVARLVHRGPDDLGYYRDPHAALGFRRLAIVDLPGGHQPLANEARTIWTVFNGEIYNFPSLRRRLEAKGHTLASSGDTEVLVHLYEDENVGMFSLLRGMFALAIWDAPKRRLILARDRMGQKPLYYRRTGDSIVFASELKSLLSIQKPAIPRTIDPRALDNYLTYGYILHPDTIFAGIHKLPPAHYAVWHEGSLTMERYWDPGWNLERARSIDEEAEELRQTLADAVREQMVADVPLGAFLSGGIDSTIIAGLMQKSSSHAVKTFSIGFDDPAFDESAYAEIAAKRMGSEHHLFVIAPKAWETIPALADQFDEPFADSSALPTWHVSQQTRSFVTVALTGDAGDELFGGYDRYRALAMANVLDRLPAGSRRWLGGPLARTLPASVRAKTQLRRVRRWLEALDQSPRSRFLRWVSLFDEASRAGLYSDDWLDKLASASLDSPSSADPASVLYRAWDAAPARDDPSRGMIADLLTYLPGDLLVKVDLASMAHSLECRGPFMDHRVVELAVAIAANHKLKIQGARSKIVLKRAFADLLPKQIARRSKMGFGVPLDRWFRGPLQAELRSVLLDPKALGRGIFRPQAVERLIDEHTNSTRDNAYKLWALLMLELWFERYGDAG